MLADDHQEDLLNQNNKAPLYRATAREQSSQAMDAITNAVIHGRGFAKTKAG